MAQSRQRDVTDLARDQCIELAYGIHRGHDALEAHVEAFGRRHDLGASHLSILHALGLGGAMRMKDLAARVVVGAATITRRAKQLEGRALVHRNRSEESQREVLIGLTEAGRAMFDASFRHLHGAHQQYFDERFTPTQKLQLLRLLDKL